MRLFARGLADSGEMALRQPKKTIGALPIYLEHSLNFSIMRLALSVQLSACHRAPSFPSMRESFRP